MHPDSHKGQPNPFIIPKFPAPPKFVSYDENSCDEESPKALRKRAKQIEARAKAAKKAKKKAAKAYRERQAAAEARRQVAITALSEVARGINASASARIEAAQTLLKMGD